MASAEEYRQRIYAEGLAELRVDVSSVPQARMLKKGINVRIKRLRFIKKDIQLEIQRVRAEHATHSRTAGSGGAMLFTLLGKRKIAGTYRADVKRSLRNSLDRVIDPYERVRGMIDDMIIQLDQAKLRLDTFASGVEPGSENVAEALPPPLPKPASTGNVLFRALASLVRIVLLVVLCLVVFAVALTLWAVLSS